MCSGDVCWYFHGCFILAQQLLLLEIDLSCWVWILMIKSHNSSSNTVERIHKIHQAESAEYFPTLKKKNMTVKKLKIWLIGSCFVSLIRFFLRRVTSSSHFLYASSLSSRLQGRCCFVSIFRSLSSSSFCPGVHYLLLWTKVQSFWSSRSWWPVCRLWKQA